MSLYNVTATSCANWRAALARQYSGGAAVRLLIAGDSNTDHAAGSWWNFLLDRLGGSQPDVWVRGYTYLSQQNEQDPLRSYGTDWVLANTGGGPGQGGMLSSTRGVTSAGEFTFGPVDCDTFILWYSATAAGGQFTYAVDNGAHSAPVEADTDVIGGSGRFIRLQIPAGGPGPHTLRLLAQNETGEATGFPVLEWETSGAPRRKLTAAGRFGTGTQHWAHVWSLDDIYRGPVPDLTLALVGSNDVGYIQEPTATTLANLTTWIDRARSVGGDFILCVPPPIEVSAGVYGPPQDLIDGLYALADSKDVPLVDLAARWIDFPTAKFTNGYISDGVHFTTAGHQDVARQMEAAVLAVSGEALQVPQPQPSASGVYRLIDGAATQIGVYGLDGGQLVSRSISR